MKVAFGTVFFPQSKAYIDDFINSINNQSYHNFDLLVINDGIEPAYIKSIKNVINVDCIVKEINAGATISSNRIALFKLAKELDYNLIILGDFDDCFEKYRLEKIVKNLENNYTFYYHNLINSVDYKSVFYHLPKITDNINQILQCNYLGLSNTAIYIDNIDKDFFGTLDEIDTNVFDWYFYSRLLLEHKYGKRIEGNLTIYRQHDDNIIGTYNNEIDLKQELKVKLKHYEILKKYSSVFADLYDNYKNNNFVECSQGYKYEGYWWSNLHTGG